MTQLSDYERQRLDNIAANQAHLESLGLAGGARGLLADKTKITRQPKRKRDDDEDGEAGLVDVRRSSRLCDAPKTYVELSHEDMLREEREMEGMERSTIRPRRACGKPVTFVQKQGEEQEERQKVNTARRSAISQRIAVETKQRHQAASEAREENMRLKQQQRAATQPDVSTLPQPVPPPTPFQAYPTKRPKRLCIFCRGSFVPNMDGSDRVHTCVPLNAVRSALAV